MFTITTTIMILMVLASVGFFTLMERKILSYMQSRKGPNKVGFQGILQPFSDGMKLFLKEYVFPFNSNFIVFFISPFLGILQSLTSWMLFPYSVNYTEFNLGFMFFLMVLSLSIYVMIISGWSSNSYYSMIGAMRSVSQAISYEVTLSMVLMMYMLLLESYSFNEMFLIQKNQWMMIMSVTTFYIWISCCLAETNRSPFDFSEGESELVSGFNVEYGSKGFALLFISEYSSIIFMSMISCMMFLGGNFFEFSFFLKMSIVCFLFIWIRSSVPRYRYDLLMYMAWKCYLPMTLNMIMFFIMVKNMLSYHFFKFMYYIKLISKIKLNYKPSVNQPN
uniref:NADH-ubiquinone oxidoreductase chain 1 n=2 Tax=Ledra TaxID=1310350 RepID=A0A6B9QEG9_9HEMI|nr:NADH dehydrogenase subunit 1 [Ledra auditura]UGK73320.1 NADH dehydrogenase subunit 1 [Ledra trigona]